jgi:hypothetical protein
LVVNSYSGPHGPSQEDDVCLPPGANPDDAFKTKVVIATIARGNIYAMNRTQLYCGKVSIPILLPAAPLLGYTSSGQNQQRKKQIMCDHEDSLGVPVTFAQLVNLFQRPPFEQKTSTTQKLIFGGVLCIEDQHSSGQEINVFEPRLLR